MSDKKETNMKTKISISIPLAAILLCAILTAVSADIAPPLQPPGANPAPLEYEKTQVEMGFETVLITVEEASTLYYADTPTDTVNARVVALFAMSNRSESLETLEVLFPLNNTEGVGDWAWGNPEIQNLSISVNDQPANWVVKTTPNPRDSDEPEIKWAEFEVEFPSQEVTFIEIRYDLQSTGYFPEATFYYILETGGGWKGPIGEAHIDLILPYEASGENVLFGDHNMMPFVYKTSPDGEFEDNEVHWEYTNLEPDAADNWVATIIAPPIWEQILDLRERIDQGDGHAYPRITTLYDALIMNRSVRPGTEGLILKNYDAYQKALEFDAWDDDVQARFANFMIFLYEQGLDSQALEENPFNDTAYQVINWLEHTHDFHPDASSTATEQPAESEEQSPESGSVEDTTITTEDQQEDLSQDDESQNNTTPFLLGAGLLAAVGVIMALRLSTG